jgi:hypothetical protein
MTDVFENPELSQRFGYIFSAMGQDGVDVPEDIYNSVITSDVYASDFDTMSEATQKFLSSMEEKYGIAPHLLPPDGSQKDESPAATGVRDFETKIPYTVDNFETGEPEQGILDLESLSDEDLSKYLTTIPQAMEELVFRAIHPTGE